jgi:hypothetical protein
MGVSPKQLGKVSPLGNSIDEFHARQLQDPAYRMTSQDR